MESLEGSETVEVQLERTCQDGKLKLVQQGIVLGT